MSFALTSDQLTKILANNTAAAQWYAACVDILPKYQITSSKRLAAFFSQCGHESNNFTVLAENLNYSAQGLANTWPTRYAAKNSAGVTKKPYAPNGLASSLHRNPEAIANNVYANRLGNGTEQSGEGFLYRGRGIIQLTGKENYQAFASSIGLSLDVTVSYCATSAGALESACWYWNKNKLNAMADELPTGAITTQAFTKLTKAINGGIIGLDDRTSKYNTAIAILEI